VPSHFNLVYCAAETCSCNWFWYSCVSKDYVLITRIIRLKQKLGLAKIHHIQLIDAHVTYGPSYHRLWAGIAQSV